MEIYNTEHTCTKIIWFKIDLIVWKYGKNTDKLFIGVEFKIDLIVWKFFFINFFLSINKV